MSNNTDQQVPVSSLGSVLQKLEDDGKPLSALPADAMIGSRARDNNVFEREYVEGALELAEMLDIADRGSWNPTKGLSFRAKNGKYYDFMLYWTSMVEQIKQTQQMNEALTTAYMTQEKFLDIVGKEMSRYKNIILIFAWTSGIAFLSTLGLAIKVFFYS